MTDGLCLEMMQLGGWVSKGLMVSGFSQEVTLRFCGEVVRSRQG